MQHNWYCNGMLTHPNGQNGISSERETRPGEQGARQGEAGQARVEATDNNLQGAHGGRGDNAEDEADVEREVVVPEGYPQALPQARRVPAPTRAHACSGQGCAAASNMAGNW